MCQEIKKHVEWLFRRCITYYISHQKMKASWHFWPLAYIWPLADSSPVGLGCVHLHHAGQIYLEKSPKWTRLFTNQIRAWKSWTSAWKWVLITQLFIRGWKAVWEYHPKYHCNVFEISGMINKQRLLVFNWTNPY